MKRVYKKSKKLLQASSLLALALGSPLKAADPESPADRDTRAVAKQFAAEHPIEQGDPFQLSSYIEYRNVAPGMVDYLPENTRGGLLRSIGMLSDDEFTLEHKLLVSSVFETLQKDQTDSLHLFFNENKILGSHKLLGLELIDLTRFFGDADSHYFNTFEVRVHVGDELKSQDTLSRLSQSGISHLKLDMEELVFTDSQFSEEGKAEKLSTFFQSGWNQLVALDLSRIDIGSEAVTAIANNPYLTNLQSLNLRDNHIGPEGLTAITNSPYLTNLLSLDLRNNQIENHIAPEGLTAIANSQTLAKLKSLDLSDNFMGPEAVTAIANSPYLTNLQSLNLSGNYADSEAITAIANSQTLTNLQSLDLSRNYIGAAGAIALANSQTLAKLQGLDLSNNQIGAAGATAIANSPTLTNLHSLNLDHNDIRAAGATAIANSQTLINLLSLNLRNNSIDEAEMTAIKNSPIFVNTQIEF